MVTVQRLDHHGVADPLGQPDRSSGYGLMERGTGSPAEASSVRVSSLLLAMSTATEDVWKSWWPGSASGGPLGRAGRARSCSAGERECPG